MALAQHTRLGSVKHGGKKIRSGTPRCTTSCAAVQGGIDGAAEPLCNAAKGSAEVGSPYIPNDYEINIACSKLLGTRDRAVDKRPVDLPGETEKFWALAPPYAAASSASE
jgi:hypothetical protein